MNHREELNKLKARYRGDLFSLQEALASDITMLLKARGRPFMNPAYFPGDPNAEEGNFFQTPATNHISHITEEGILWVQEMTDYSLLEAITQEVLSLELTVRLLEELADQARTQ